MNEKPTPRRRLTLLDLTLMVAAAALALAGFQFAVTRVFRGWLDYSRWPGWIARPTPRFVLYMLSDATAPLIPLAGAWTGLLPVLRMLPPRPPRRRAWRQPGMGACLAALLAMLWGGLTALLMLGLVSLFPTWRASGRSFVQEFFVGHLFPLVGIAVAATWCPLLLSGRWAKPADWIDRVGRVVGILWILIGLAWTLRSYNSLI